MRIFKLLTLCTAIGAGTLAAPDNAIHRASAADVEAWEALAETIRADVLAEIDAKGIDAAAAHAMVKAEMAKH